jgi:hypothetical protein
MYILAKLVFKSYLPKRMEIGMWFKKDHSDVVLGKVYNYFTIYELKEIPNDMYEYMSINGAPVEPFIVQPMRNRDEREDVLVEPENIGWWEMDEGSYDEDDNWQPNVTLEDLSPAIINAWIHGENAENDGLIALEVDEDGEPLFYDGSIKVVIRPTDHVNDDEWYDEDNLLDDDDDDEDSWEDDEWPIDDTEPNDGDHETE